MEDCPAHLKAGLSILGTGADAPGLQEKRFRKLGIAELTGRVVNRPYLTSHLPKIPTSPALQNDPIPAARERHGHASQR